MLRKCSRCVAGDSLAPLIQGERFATREAHCHRCPGAFVEFEPGVRSLIEGPRQDPPARSALLHDEHFHPGHSLFPEERNQALQAPLAADHRRVPSQRLAEYEGIADHCSYESALTTCSNVH
eukprot:scaffold3346_cov313-Pinguiococcus_pyrenoidosus.AAC.6